jgi:hypothetical protein
LVLISSASFASFAVQLLDLGLFVTHAAPKKFPAMSASAPKQSRGSRNLTGNRKAPAVFT